MIDHEGVIRYWNPAATAIFGYTAEEAVGRGPFTFLVAPEKADALLADYRAWQAAGASSLVGPPHRQPRAAQERRALPDGARDGRGAARAAGSGPARC